MATQPPPRESSATLGCLGEQHLRWFGAILQWFAHHELLMQRIMATVAGSDTAAVMILTRHLDFSGKRGVLLDLLRHRAVPANQFDRINAFLMIPHTQTALRNDIAHTAWIESPSPDSIQPDWILRPPASIEALRDDPYIPSDQLIQHSHEKIAYTLKDLRDIADDLAANFESFAAYAREVGLVREGGADS